MLKNSSATLHFSANYCLSLGKQYSGYRNLLACFCLSIYKMRKLACSKNFVCPLSLSSGKGHSCEKFVAKQQIQISKCLWVDTLQNNDLPCMKLAVTSSSISCCFVCDLLALLSHCSLMAEKPSPKRDLCTNSGMTRRRNPRIQKPFPSSGFLSRPLFFLFLECAQ